MSERSFKGRPQCGLCNAVSNVFRRLLCVGPSRRGSSESYYQQLDPVELCERERDQEGENEKIRTELREDTFREEEEEEEEEAVAVAVAVAAATATATATATTTTTTTGTRKEKKTNILSRIEANEPAAKAENLSFFKRNTELSNSELRLMKIAQSRSRSMIFTSRFLTIHKRRRKKLTTRFLSPEFAPAILDDIHHGLVKCVLDRVGKWPFNAFTLDVATGGRSLPVLCIHLFHWYGLMNSFKLEAVDVWKLFTLIEEGYHSTNPYHNSVHATDVTQAMHCFLQEEKIKRHLTPLEIMASLIAAVSHDLDHPGVNQPFLIATSNHLAALYQNTSVLENHHWRSAIGCLLESHVADHLKNDMFELERQISSLILATDITRQQEFLSKFKRYLNQNALNMEKEEDRHFILQIALKCADISNPCRPWDISRKWSQKVCEEFFRQGDYEQQLGLPLTALCDRGNSSVPKIQSGFFKFVVIPLFDEWHRFLGTKLSTNMMAHLRLNHNKWDFLLEQELAEETRTEISDAEENVMDEEVKITSTECESESRRYSLPSVMLEMVDKSGRRHSVPLNLSKDNNISATVSSHCGGGRRESLPTFMEPRCCRLAIDSFPHLEEEDEELDISFKSSCSGGSMHKSSDCASVEERPVSAENLLPEPSIATITNSLDATRLSNVLHGSGMLAPPICKILTRQQTFPPIQTFARARYMSTAGEIVALTSASNSTSTSSSKNELNNSLKTASSGSEFSGSYNLKKNSFENEREKNGKSQKFRGEKENINPRKYFQQSKQHSSLQELLFVCKETSASFHENVSSAKECSKVGMRRGSVPSDHIRVGLTENKTTRRSSLPFDLLNQFNISFSAAVLTSYTSVDAMEISKKRNSENGKCNRRSTRSRKSLKRRSSGGPDILLPRENFNIPRRGSLPYDILSSYGKS